VLRALIESRTGWEVCGEAENGFAAVGKVRELKPDLVILDLAMPVMDGIRAARELLSIAPGLPILMHTMHGSPAVNLEAKKAGISKVISKGASGESLLEAIDELLKVANARTLTDVGGLKVEAASASASAAESKTGAREKSTDAPNVPPEGEKPSEPN
jgi:two-component system chemotaxis response regulator CheY